MRAEADVNGLRVARWLLDAVPMVDSAQTLRIGGRSVRVSNLDRVLYPADGTTKGDVIGYYGAIAEHMLAHCRDRAATRKRWPQGVGEDGQGAFFFQKDIGEHAPDWVATASIEHRDHSNDYPLVNDEATLVWLAQLASLEIHVPQWRFDADGRAMRPDRMVLDLDPGPGVDLRQCARIATRVRAILDDMGLATVPVTSGSKGIHLYAQLDGSQTSEQVSAVARELARALEADHPDEVTSVMKRASREGRVFIDWSQNNASKTTVAPYSLRGRARPTVAAPRTWRELASPHLRQLEFREVLARVRRRGDPMAPLSARPDRLELYRAKRDGARTPEPVPEPGEDEDRGGSDPVFVIQRHQARRLHFDFRLEHDGVLVSWALPKGVPDDPGRNHLAVPTEDHPISYRTFEGSIPRGEYGAGTVQIWDAGTCSIEKWQDDEVIVTLHGRADGGLGGTGRFALFRTGTDPAQWMIHRFAPGADSASVSRASSERALTRAPASAAPLVAAPMLATATDPRRMAQLDPSAWAFEMKWDGMRILAEVDHERVRLRSRAGEDVTGWFPELQQLTEALDTDSAVLDGEAVVCGDGVPSFALLQTRLGLQRDADVRAAQATAPVTLLLFDVLAINGTDCRTLPYAQRRELLEEIVAAPAPPSVQLPAAFEGSASAAMESARERGLEGIVAKRRDAPYRSGSRSADWLKAPFVQTAEAVIVGWRESEANPAGFRSLLLAVPEGASLVYAGRVSSGLGTAQQLRLRAVLERMGRREPPLQVPASDRHDAHWVEPTLIGEVSFRERTASGRFRHPVWRGLRPDRSIADLQ